MCRTTDIVINANTQIAARLSREGKVRGYWTQQQRRPQTRCRAFSNEAGCSAASTDDDPSGDVDGP